MFENILVLAGTRACSEGMASCLTCGGDGPWGSTGDTSGREGSGPRVQGLHENGELGLRKM